MLSRVRSISRVALACVLAILLAACNGASTGMNAFQSPDGRYAFLYPNGWTRIAMSGGPQVVLHDLINSDETVSLAISKVEEQGELQSLGSPIDIGQRLTREVIAPEGSGREAELLEAKQRESAGHFFYDLEYTVHIQDRERHELATVVVDRGRLYTLAASTNEMRWPKVKGLFEQVITSFTFLV